MSLARRPQPAPSCMPRDEARRIDDVRAIGSAVARPSGGEEDAFRSLIEPHRPALHAHCYRMAEDATFAKRTAGGRQAGVSAVKGARPVFDRAGVSADEREPAADQRRSSCGSSPTTASSPV